MKKNLDWQNTGFVDWYNAECQFEDQELAGYISLLNLCRKDIVLDLGCGDGTLLFHIADFIEHGIGVDCSSAQIKAAESKLCTKTNINLLLHSLEAIDKGMIPKKITKGSARLSLHHLKDQDKCSLFETIGVAFCEGALFLIDDVILDFDKLHLEENMDKILKDALNYYGEAFEDKKDMLLDTIFNEEVTDIFQMEKALNAGGFEVESYFRDNCFSGKILGRRRP